MTPDAAIQVPVEVLSRWADSCLHMNHLGTLTQRELEAGNFPRAHDLSERARIRAWSLLNELFDLGVPRPEGYAHPAART